MNPIKEFKVRIAALCMVFLLCIVSQGCVQDDLSECGIGVQFRYIKNVDRIDKFPSAVNRITLFVFDENERYLGSYTGEGEPLKDNYIMNVPLKEGNYKLIAWGNLYDCYDITDCIPGTTTMEEFMLKVKNTDNTVSEHPVHLFYGGVEEVEVKEEAGRKYVLIDLTKDTNTIYVSATGLPLGVDSKADYASGTPFRCAITSRNGEYYHDNSITGERLTYIPQYAVEEKKLKSDFVIMRELNDASLTESRLILTHEETEKELLNWSLTELLLPAAITGDLDIDDEFHIDVEFDYTNGSFSIKVNDFVVVDNGGSIIG
ncbi:hypothetical protein M2463_003766 [Parabacteroides sp. PH5-13]|uniref:FimB/Mfa2 family fimbrial subunit n=2 Tax=unclassified Parabacteroides TaxID=2649774 RepID=UPI0024755346|nr:MULTISPECIES: FimB/Mfa2 family fimbrial subunit [unclassified Parabacteroides]MDH6321726.1 hypothetical protein [Parabacteroides sp. PH5-13]MDH6325465.1 hypothetical protein [Parabacteroides sp. PH5-8]MDH6386578.1 hypothetical protein [Parabacteroides sp. PH5-17]MDH6395953.1 hypothetical protein [Parabacteroides sp. PFB2-22]MDH6409043.1 hypothetical protein [Parabacteroides sp. PH5-26]